MTDLPTYVLDRHFAAPPALVWRCWTEPDLLARWYGPNVETVIHALDVRPGGVWLNEMRMQNGSHYQRMDFTAVEPGVSLSGLMAGTDAEWRSASSPMMPDWPRVLLTKVTLTEVPGGTDMRLVWTPHEASAAEIDCFAKAVDGLGRGWGAGMDLLEELLAELQT